MNITRNKNMKMYVPDMDTDLDTVTDGDMCVDTEIIICQSTDNFFSCLYESTPDLHRTLTMETERNLLSRLYS